MAHSSFDRQIAKRCALTPCGLKALARAASDPEGWVTGPGKGGAAGACGPLEKAALVELAEGATLRGDLMTRWGRYRITPLGRQRVAMARAWGW